MKKILVPTDFTPLSDNALEFACALAEHTGCEIFLCNIQSLPANDDASMAIELIKTIQTANEERLSGLADDCRKAHKELKISTHFSFGIPSGTIKDYLQTGEFSYVVMGTRGAEGIDRFFMGSVAESVSKHAPCPVFVVHGKNEFVKPKDIVVPIDINYKFNESYKVVNKIVAFAAIFGARLHWCYVETEGKREKDGGIHFQLEDGSRIDIDVVHAQTVEKGIENYCSGRKVDLLAIIKRDYGFVERIFHHDVFGELMKNQKFPLMVIHY